MTGSRRSRQKLGVAVAAHVRRLEVGRLLVDEQDEADPLVAGVAQVGQQAGQFEHGRRPAAVVVGARRVLVGVVVRADHDGLGAGIRAGRLDDSLDVADRAVFDLVDLRHRLIAERLQRLLDIARGFFQLVIVIDIVRLAGDGADVGRKARRGRLLGVARRRQGALVRLAGYGGEIARAGNGNRRHHDHEQCQGEQHSPIYRGMIPAANLLNRGRGGPDRREIPAGR